MNAPGHPPANSGVSLAGGSLFLVLFVLVTAGYGFNLGNSFLSDDWGLLWAAESATTFPQAAGLEVHDGPRFLRPVVSLSWWAAHALFGLAPFPHHLFNVLFHLLNAWLLAWVVFGLTRHRLASWATGAAFAVYPIHPEAVTWVAGRVDVFATTGYLAALGFWVRFARAEGRVRHLAAAAACFAFGVLSKEMAATLPIAAAAVLPFLRDRAPTRRLVLGLGLLAIVLGGYLGVRLMLYGGIGGYRSADGTSLHEQVDVGVAGQFTRLAMRQAAAPAVRDRHPSRFDPLRSLPLIAVGLAALVTLATGGRRRLLRHALLGITLFLVALLPLLGWAVLGDDGQNSRFLYLPSAFACTALGAAFLVGHIGRAGRVALLAFAVVWVSVYSSGLRENNNVWGKAALTSRIILDTAIRRTESRPGVLALVVTDLPDNHQGAYVFRNAFPQAMQLVHPRRLPAGVLPRARWDEARRAARAAGNRRDLFLRWIADEGVWGAR